MSLIADFSSKSIQRVREFFGRPKPKIGLALGGGGARGLAHIGVLRVLEREGISFEVIGGTSMGAIVGGSYAQRPEVATLLSNLERYFTDHEEDETLIKKKVGEYSGNRLSRFTSSLSYYNFLLRNPDTSSVLDGDILYRLVNALVTEGPIQETSIRFAAVAVDILSGAVAILDRGPIREAVSGSSSLPGVFPPIEWQDGLLVDGGVSHVVPVPQVNVLGADKVIAVDVSRDIQSITPPRRGVDLLYRLHSVTKYHLKQQDLSRADYVIRPQVQDFEWFEFSEYETIIERGVSAAERAMPDLTRTLKASSN